MSAAAKKDWNPETYAMFRGFRLRPALDLMMQIGTPPAGTIVDLGCGDGAAAGALRSRFPKREIIGLDASAAMLAKARGYDRLITADIDAWEPDAPVSVIFSNAALHWLPDHAVLMPRLAAMLPPYGVLAVQMPRQQMAPSHALMRQIAAEMFPDRFDFGGWQPQVAAPEAYHRMLSPLGTLSVWETTYFQRLDAVTEGHPVRHFTQSTAMRPFVEVLDDAAVARFVAAYDAALDAAYPRDDDGAVLFPFQRLFFTLTV